MYFAAVYILTLTYLCLIVTRIHLIYLLFATVVYVCRFLIALIRILLRCHVIT